MTCRTRRDAGPGRRRLARCSRYGRDRSPAACPHPAPAGPAAELVLRVAALVPAPGNALRADDSAWEAFGAFLDEAARLVTDTLDHADVRTLRALRDSAPGDDVVTRLLIERALTRWDLR